MSSPTLIERLQKKIKREGALPALLHVAQYPFARLAAEKRKAKILGAGDIEERFTEIYRSNFWGSEESASGPGSTLECTANLRRELPEMFRKFEIKSVFDAPCGDFNWMKLVVNECSIQYTGADIVKPLIDSLQARYQSNKVSFLHVDITKDDFPSADLWICRDCLFHLSFDDTLRALRRFLDSGIRYMLTTTYDNPGRIENRDIKTGESRFMDLCSTPYLFPREKLYAIADNTNSAESTQMCLWSREQLALSVEEFAKALQLRSRAAV